ncbi:hypothetical protein U1Q18_044726 [Sarracenia purpurea var. burkii]
MNSLSQSFLEKPQPNIMDESLIMQESQPGKERMTPRQGTTIKQWLSLAAVCVVGGFILANLLYKPAPKVISDDGLHVYVHMDGVRTVAEGTAGAALPHSISELSLLNVGDIESAELMRRLPPLNPFTTFIAGNAGAKVSHDHCAFLLRNSYSASLTRDLPQVGLVVGGVSTFNTGVSNCDQGHYASRVTGIITSILLTAAGLWAPVPGRRSLDFGYQNLTIAMSEFDPNSDHHVHRFISNYQEAIARDPTLALGSRVGYVQYAQTAINRHRLVVIPRGNGIGRRQDNENDDGGSVSYEWNDFGSSGDKADTSSDDYSALAGDVTQYLQDNESNNICLTQCTPGTGVNEVGSLQTQAGTDPDYNSDCEYSDDMVECS